MSQQGIRKLGLNQRLALVALVMGVVALFGAPRSESTVTINSRELALVVERTFDHIMVDELADWIIQGRSDFRLLDVRDKEEFDAYHIPNAESVELHELADYPLSKNEKIVVYSGGGMHSAQAWFFLKAAGYPGAYILFGGLEEWKDLILFPSLPADPDPTQLAAVQRAQQVSEFFGGSPRSGGAALAETSAIPMPTVKAPSHAPVARAKRPRKEGC